MAEQTLKIAGVDRVNGGILVHFSNGVSIHYGSQFLWDARQKDGNITVPNEILDE